MIHKCDNWHVIDGPNNNVMFDHHQLVTQRMAMINNDDNNNGIKELNGEHIMIGIKWSVDND